jgi:hypothetical protein
VFVLDEQWVEQYVAEDVKRIARNMGIPPVQFLFNAGHDWEIALTVDVDDFLAVRDAMRAAGGDLAALGVVVGRDGGREELARRVALRSQPERPSGPVRMSYLPFFTDEKFVRRTYEDRPLEWEDLTAFLEGQQPVPDALSAGLCGALGAVWEKVRP